MTAAGAVIATGGVVGGAGVTALVVGLDGADKMLGGARRVREPLALVGALGGADTRRAEVRGGVRGFGLSVLGPSSRGGTLGKGTPRPVRFEGGPLRRGGSAGGRERVSASRGASTWEAGGAGREREGALGVAIGLLAADGVAAFGAEPAGLDGSGTGGGSRPATS